MGKTSEEKAYPGLSAATKVCNCCECGTLLLSRLHETWLLTLPAREQLRLPPLRYHSDPKGRPLCGSCKVKAEIGDYELPQGSDQPAAVRRQLIGLEEPR